MSEWNNPRILEATLTSLQASHKITDPVYTVSAAYYINII